MKRLLVLACLLSLSLACKSESARSATPAAVPPSDAPPLTAGALPGKPLDGKPEVKTESGLAYYDLREGAGAAATAGQTVTVHYTGYLNTGAKFDSSLDRGEPFSFPLGAGNVIKGWDQGVAGMKPGAMRKLVIPSQLGYGTHGAGRGLIPPNSTLIFDVELISAR